MGESEHVRRTRRAYDAVAADYVAWARDDLAARPLDRALLGWFAELVGDGPALDVGCGGGRITAHLHALGVDVSGVDLSPNMVALARAAHPGLRFSVGSMTDLALPDASVDGLLAYYSTIHVPDDELPTALAEFHRVLTPGGHALLVFQVGDEPLVLTDVLGHDVELSFLRRHPERMAVLLEEAGLSVRSHTVRRPDPDERTPQAYLLARR